MKLNPNNYLLRCGHHKNLFTRSELIDILIEYDAQKTIDVEGFKTFHEAIIWKYGTVSEAKRRLRMGRTSLYRLIDNPNNLRLSQLKRLQKDGINAVQLFNLDGEGAE